MTTSSNLDSRSPETDRQAIVDSINANIAALLAGDADAAGALQSDDYVSIHISGRRFPKEQGLDNIRSGRYQYHKVTKISPVSVELNGDEATAKTVNDVEATINGAHGTWRLATTTTFRYEHGRWLSTSATAQLTH